MDSKKKKRKDFQEEDVKVWFKCFVCGGYVHSIPALRSHAEKEHGVAPQDVRLPKVLPHGAKKGKVYTKRLPWDWKRKCGSVSTSPEPLERCDIRIRNVAELLEQSSEGDEEASRQQDRDKPPDDVHSQVASPIDSGMFDDGISEVPEDEVPQHRTIVPIPKPCQKPERASSSNCQPAAATVGPSNSEKDKGFTCEICRKSFKNKGVLNFHMKKLHPQKSQNSEPGKEKLVLTLRRDAETGNFSSENSREMGSTSEDQHSVESPSPPQRRSNSPPKDKRRSASLPQDHRRPGSPPQDSFKSVSSRSASESPPISRTGNSDKGPNPKRKKSNRPVARSSSSSFKAGSESGSSESSSEAGTESESSDYEGFTTIRKKHHKRKTRPRALKSGDNGSQPQRRSLRKRRARNDSGTSKSEDPATLRRSLRKRRRRNPSEASKSTDSDSEDSTPKRRKLRKRRNETATLDSEDSTPKRRKPRITRNETATSDSEDSTPKRRKLRKKRNDPATSKSSDSEDSTTAKSQTPSKKRDSSGSDGDSSSQTSSSSIGDFIVNSSTDNQTEDEGELSDKSTTSEEDASSTPDLTDYGDDEKEKKEKKKRTSGTSSRSNFSPVKKKATGKGDKNKRSKSPTPLPQCTTVCKSCKLECKNSAALILHIKTAHKSVRLICGYCEKKYKTKERFNKHIMTHREVQNQ